MSAMRGCLFVPASVCPCVFLEPSLSQHRPQVRRWPHRWLLLLAPLGQAQAGSEGLARSRHVGGIVRMHAFERLFRR